MRNAYGVLEIRRAAGQLGGFPHLLKHCLAHRTPAPCSFAELPWKLKLPLEQIAIRTPGSAIRNPTLTLLDEWIEEVPQIWKTFSIARSETCSNPFQS